MDGFLKNILILHVVFNNYQIMEINILQLLEGAGKATGLTVIIDVFRAFSTACYAMEQGANRIYPAGSIEDAFNLKKKFPGAILIGERNEKKPEGFDFGNSPTHILNAGLRGKNLIHTTSSGTQGIVNARNAEQIITGSFVNAGAIVRYIKKINLPTVSLVCMGYACEYPTDEDTFCAEYIRNEVMGLPSDWETMKKTIRVGTGARFFEETSQTWAPSSDFDMCLQLNKFNFVLKTEMEKDILFLNKIDV
jgi:2-phosphosulfolactate phosphatase